MALPRRGRETGAPSCCASHRPGCRRIDASIMRPHPDLATSPRRIRLGNRLRRVGKFLEGRARLCPGHCGRDEARPSQISPDATKRVPPDFRPSTFLVFPCRRAAFPICRGAATAARQGWRRMKLASVRRQTRRRMRMRISGSSQSSAR